jgi:hypothetical protein
MDLNLLRPRSVSSPPLNLVNQFYNNNPIKTSSSDDNVVPLKQISLTNYDEMMDGRIRCLSDASDRQRCI